jgi:ATP-binding cassette, subfamily B (MDR/TAP), member 1
MAIVIILSLIIIIVLAAVNISTLKNKENEFLSIYRKAGSRAEEAINAFKTVKQFNAERY